MHCHQQAHHHHVINSTIKKENNFSKSGKNPFVAVGFPWIITSIACDRELYKTQSKAKLPHLSNLWILGLIPCHLLMKQWPSGACKLFFWTLLDEKARSRHLYGYETKWILAPPRALRDSYRTRQELKVWTRSAVISVQFILSHTESLLLRSFRLLFLFCFHSSIMPAYLNHLERYDNARNTRTRSQYFPKHNIHWLPPVVITRRLDFNLSFCILIDFSHSIHEIQIQLLFVESIY